MITLILGEGEIGLALKHIFDPYYPTIIRDRTEEDNVRTKIEVMHICFPYSEEFEKEVRRYQELFNPDYTIIHSTVPVGTSRKLNALHSPIEGEHPYLEVSIKAIPKWIGGENGSAVADYFRRAGIRVILTDNQETTELMKILSTTYYGVCVEYTKEVKEQCDKNNVPFEAWALWTENYNKGYSQLGHSEYNRPNLVPIKKKIGGHCVMQNCELLENDFTELLKKRNC